MSNPMLRVTFSYGEELLDGMAPYSLSFGRIFARGPHDRCGAISKVRALPESVDTTDASRVKRTTLSGDMEVETGRSVAFIILGASGDLAKKKIFPALFSLFEKGFLGDVNIIAYARTSITTEAFREALRVHLPRFCTKFSFGEESCAVILNKFLSHVSYSQGGYDDAEGFERLDADLNETGWKNRVFYFSIPPSVFVSAAKSIIKSRSGWTRVIMEKPFGHDLEDFEVLQKETTGLFSEQELFRIDHYLGKELVMNIMMMRFANVVFEPLWDRSCVESVHINFMENIGTSGRAGYFDEFGIVRDVMQNHLMQMLTLICMETPITTKSADVHAEKIKVLRSISAIGEDDITVGQFAGYLKEKGVPPDSITPTYARARLFVDNRRWAGVPIYLSCGKALDRRLTEITLVFKKVAGGIFSEAPSNSLVIRVQPDESIHFNIVTKAAGLSTRLVRSTMELPFAKNYSEANIPIPEAYERLLLDVVKGDPSLFIPADEMREQWRIFTPILRSLEKRRVMPIIYEPGAAPFTIRRVYPPDSYKQYALNAREYVGDSVDDFISHSIDAIGRIIRTRLAESDSCLIGLSGGTTPEPVYNAMHRIEGVDWDKVIFFLIDERYVPPDDRRSNLKMMQNSVFKVLGTPTRNIIQPCTTLPLKECVESYASALSTAFSWHGPPDLVILGMGPDGHVASLFPPLSSRHVGPRDVVNTQTRTFDISERVTVSLDVLRSAMSHIFLMKQEKRGVYVDMFCSLANGQLKDRSRWPALDLLSRSPQFIFSPE